MGGGRVYSAYEQALELRKELGTENSQGPKFKFQFSCSGKLLDFLEPWLFSSL